MTARRSLALAALIGVAAGGVAAVAIPSAQSTPTEAPFLAPAGKLTVGPALKPVTGEGQLRPHRGTVHEELRRKDPAGGPDWVIRSMQADRVIPKQFRRPNSDGVIGSGPCLQLGREVAGRFGWIDGDHVFRPVSLRRSGVMTDCPSAKLDTRKSRDASIRPVTLVGTPTSREPVILGTVVWGAVGSHVRSARLTAAGRVRTPSRSKRWGAFLEFYGPGHSASGANLKVRYSDGKVIDTARQREDTFAPPGYRPSAGDAIDPDSGVVIARAPDPGGGPSWGLSGIRTKRGLWCLGESGHLIGDRVGEIDPKLGTLWEQGGFTPNGCGSRAQPTEQYPVQSVSSSGSYTDVPGLAPERKQLRLQAGRTIISGRTLDGIDALTVSTPRDVRTVIPSEPGHGFILVYDGGFPGGKVTAVAHFRDGHTKKVELAGGGL